VDVDRIAAVLAGIVGQNRVLTDPLVLREFSRDETENDPGNAEIVVKPVSTAQVQDVVRLAAAEGIPLIPVVARTNLGGLGIPTRGGIVVDLNDMEAAEIDPVSMHAIIEPGVTFGKMAKLLEAQAPELTVSYALSPPEASVLANCILDGLGNLSLPHGTMADQIAGLEVVMPDGEIVRTGSCAVISSSWVSRAPMPDLTGLFVNWQGTTGIVTKVSVCLWPVRPLRLRRFIPTFDLGASYGLLRDLARTGLFDDLGGLTWPASKMLFGVGRPLHRDPDEPEFFIYTDMSAHDEFEMEAKSRVVARVIASHRGRLAMEDPLGVEDLTSLAPSFARFANFPMTLDFLTEFEGRGLTWIGTYGPTGAWEEASAKGSALMVKHGFPPMLVIRPMKGGHFGVLRFITAFYRDDPQEVERVKAMNAEVLEVCLDTGFIPYKTPAWVFERLRKQMDPGYLRLLEQVKGLIDPAGIMNPGRFGF